MRAHRAVAAISTLATRLAFLVVPWLVLSGTASVGWAVTTVGVQTLAYVIGWPIGAVLTTKYVTARLTLIVDLVSTVLLASIAFAYTDSWPFLALIAMVGLVRGISDQLRAAPPTDQPSTGDADHADKAPPREGLVLVATVLGGIALGVAVVWFGATGGLWLIAVSCALCAAITIGSGVGWIASAPTSVTAPPETAATVATVAPADIARVPDPMPVHTTEWAGYSQPATGRRIRLRRAGTGLWRNQLIRRFAIALFLINLVAQAGGVLLLTALNRDLLDGDALGFGAGAFAVGAIGAAVIFTAYAYQPTRWTALALGYLAGGGALLAIDGLAPVSLLIFAALMMAGIALGSVSPAIGLVVRHGAPDQVRGQAAALLATISYLGVPLGTFTGARIAGPASLVVATVVTTLCFVVVALIPTVIHRTWRTAVPDETLPGVRGRNSEKLRARMAVTLAYADGQWLVEVRKGRALLGSRYAVDSADALRTLTLLDVPTVHHGIEQVLSNDQDEAARQVERARAELSELEAKLTGLREMVDLSNPTSTPKRDVPDAIR